MYTPKVWSMKMQNVRPKMSCLYNRYRYISPRRYCYIFRIVTLVSGSVFVRHRNGCLEDLQITVGHCTLQQWVVFRASGPAALLPLFLPPATSRRTATMLGLKSGSEISEVVVDLACGPPSRGFHEIVIDQP